MKYAILILFLIVAQVFFLNSCNDNSVGPGDNPPPGRRDYIWEEYKIKLETDFLQLNNVWASSPTNVWGTGLSTTTAISIVHFDGTHFTPDTIVGPQSFYIHGIDSNNVWLATTNSTIWFYNGNEWSEYQKLFVDGYDRVSIQSLWGNEETGLFGTGFADNYQTSDYIGVIIELVNGQWQFHDIPDYRVSLNTLRQDPETKKYFITATNYDNGFLEKVYLYDRDKLTEIYSEYNDMAIEVLGEEMIFYNDQKIYRFNYSKQTFDLWKDLTGTSMIGGIKGRSINDFFATAVDGIGHYNGSSFETIYNISAEATPGSIVGEHIFFGGTDYDNLLTILIRGKLKEE